MKKGNYLVLLFFGGSINSEKKFNNFGKSMRETPRNSPRKMSIVIP